LEVIVAEVNPPIALQNAGSTHTAETLRNALITLLSGPSTANAMTPRGGVHVLYGGAFAVSQNGSPNMTVNVASGLACVPGTEGAKQGGYFVVNDATKNVTIAAANASLPRIDVICLQVQDSFYSGVANTWTITVVTGTAAGSPVAPAVPNDALKIAQVAVGANVTSIVNANISDFRPTLTAAGGIMRAFGTTERDALPAYGGLAVWRTDIAGGLLQIYNGTAYQDYSPAFSAFVGESRNNSTNTTSTGTEAIGTTVTWTAVAGARYKVSWYGSVQSNISADIGRVRIRHQSGVSLTSGGTQDAIRTYVSTAGEGKMQTLMATISGLTGGTQYTAGSTIQRITGTGTNQINGNLTDDAYTLVERIA
jgi:hypothetical protein